MNAVEHEDLDQVTSKVISAAYRVSNTLGPGFLEKVYENALAVELRLAAMSFKRQPSFQVRYREEVVGEYIPDLVVRDAVVVEIKALDGLNRIHQAQCMNYLRATGLKVALLFNFGSPRVQIKRIVWDF